jgi:RalA-binding protein 1
MSISSPGAAKGGPLHLVSPKPLVIAKMQDESPSSSPNEKSSPTESPTPENSIYKGLVTEEYPDLLLPPNALPSIDVRVASSRLKPSRSSILFPKNFEEDPVFTLAVFARSDQRELWRVEKDSASLAHLDQILKQSPTFTAKTPERSLFNGHAPAKVDARRAALDKYLEEVLNTQMDMNSALEICRYLSTNTMEPHAGDVTPGSSDTVSESPVKTGPGGRPLKNGYLTKRGKNFGGWKARFFVLDGPVFKYYESPGGPHLGAIKLQNAQIGKQQTQADNHSPSRGETDDIDNQYRHAFLILEPKRKDSSSLVRHVLCAESDQERDEWVEALLQYVDYKESDEDERSQHSQQHDRKTSAGSNHTNGGKSKKKIYAQGRSQTLPEMSDDGLRAVSYENTKPGGAPTGVRNKNSNTPPPAYENQSSMPQSQSMKSISAPKNAQVIQDGAAWGNRQQLLAPSADVKQKKRSFFGFGSKPRASTESQDIGANDSNTNLSQMAFDQHGPIRPAFGAPLGEAVKYNHPVDVSIELPAVVYRCIEYLDAKNAAGEEGIFRLSGSNVVIKQLRERFNVEGDVNLVTDDQYYDIHAVASLLKLYLRELPTTILTRELHLEFLAVTELHDLHEKVAALNGLVYRLPRPNHALLRYLAGFLLNIISHAETNKMTVRNVGIVFSPTLNIPAPVFALFLQQYHEIFDAEPDSQAGNVEFTVTAPPLTPEDIRSPRRQKFQDLPTPSYDQQSFPQQQPPPQFPPPQHYQQRGNYDTGFTPLQPSYEGAYPTMAGPEYGRSTPTLAGPSYDQFNGGTVAYRQYGTENPSGPKKRRESSMFGMNIGLGQRKPSSNKLRDDSRLVEDESFFD